MGNERLVTVLTDAYNRRVNYLRISITDRCNLRCSYCMPKNGVVALPKKEVLRYEEIITLCRVAWKLGIEYFRISGGEPLVREGVLDFVKAFKEALPNANLAMTSNGVLLSNKAEALALAGLDSVNISLDSLKESRFTRICGFSRLESVIAGIDAAIASKMRVKLNTLLLADLIDELQDLLDFGQSRNIPLRFIELMPLDPQLNERLKEGKLETTHLLQEIKSKETVFACADTEGAGPARYFELPERGMRIGLITAMSQPFCHRCNRIRLTSDGKLKPCLSSSFELDVKTCLRSGGEEKELSELFRKAIEKKPKAHCLSEGRMPQRVMPSIGG